MKKKEIDFEKEYYKLLKKYIDELNFCRYLQKCISTYHDFLYDYKLESELNKYVQNIKSEQ